MMLSVITSNAPCVPVEIFQVSLIIQMRLVNAKGAQQGCFIFNSFSRELMVLRDIPKSVAEGENTFNPSDSNLVRENEAQKFRH